MRARPVVQNKANLKEVSSRGGQASNHPTSHSAEDALWRQQALPCKTKPISGAGSVSPGWRGDRDGTGSQESEKCCPVVGRGRFPLAISTDADNFIVDRPDRR